MTTTTDPTVDQSMLARCLGVSARHVRRLEKQGLDSARVSDPGDTPLYDLARAVRWFIDSRLQDEDDELRRARIRKTAADAQIREDQLRQSRGQLIPADRVLGKIREPLEAVDAKLKSAPRTHAKALATKAGVTRAVAIALLQDVVQGVRADLRSVFE